MATSVEPEGLSQSCDAMLTIGDEEWEGETGEGYGHAEMTALHHFVTEHGVNQAIVLLKSGADKFVTCESRPVCLKCGAVLRYLKFTCSPHTQWGEKTAGSTEWGVSQNLQLFFKEVGLPYGQVQALRNPKRRAARKRAAKK